MEKETTYLIRSMVHNKIQEQPHTTGMEAVNELLHVLESAIRRINSSVVRDVIAHVNLRRLKY